MQNKSKTVNWDTENKIVYVTHDHEKQPLFSKLLTAKKCSQFLKSR